MGFPKRVAEQIFRKWFDENPVDVPNEVQIRPFGDENRAPFDGLVV